MDDDDSSRGGPTSTFGVLLKAVASPTGSSPREAPDLLGARLHQYKVVALLGRGGMGVVYRAQDTRLGREVALKVLPRAVSDDPERRSRFLREARSAAAITHPNIATIHEVGEAEGRVFLVMELVEGETLHDKLRHGPLAIAEVVRIGRAVARGLAKAHDKGIVHRDLKPENVMLTPEGDVKILDFGLAKVLAEPGSRSELENQPTDVVVTEAGVVMGTLAYMSPEQASGANVDLRTDVFSLGVVLYEMATARRPFEGETRREVLAALLRDEPTPPSRHNPRVGADLEQTILRSLRKKPDERPASAEQIVAALGESAALERRTRRGAWIALATVGALVATVASLVAFGRTRAQTGGQKTFMGGAAAAPAPTAGVATAPMPTVTRIIDLPPPPTQVPAAAAAFASAMQAAHDDSWMKAIGLFARAAELDPNVAAYHLYLSLASVEANNPAARRAEYEKAAGLRAQLGPRDLGVLEALQPLLQGATQDVGETDARLRALAERYPGDEEIWMLLGVIHYATSAALEPAQHALALDPEDGQSWENKGHGFFSVGRYAEAREAYAHCGGLTIDSADCFLWVGLTHAMEGQCTEYAREVKRAADREPFWSIPALAAKASTGLTMPELQAAAEPIVSSIPAPMKPAWIGSGIAVRLAILDGDFTRAGTLARKEEAAIAADPELRSSYGAHYDLTAQRLEIALETGDDAAVRTIVADFVAHQGAWANEVLFSHAVDLSLSFARLAFRASEPPPPEFEAQRKAWIERALFAGADRAQVWDYAYASPALTPAEADAALERLAEWGPPTPVPTNLLSSWFGRVGSPDADLGRVYLLAGRVDDAVAQLQKAAAQCDLYTSTLDHVRSSFDLGRALEQTGDRRGACDAYAHVLDRWGAARPRSVTADAARTRAKALACAVAGAGR